MADKILLNKQPYQITEEALPCLITYGEHMGGSHLSITLIANLFLQGSKILFLTAYPMARENFLQQVGGDNPKIVLVDSLAKLKEAEETQAIILESGDENLFLEVSEFLPDLYERVVLVKNMEVFGKKVFDICLNLNKIILSGNIDGCIAKEIISSRLFNTIIAFNQPSIKLPMIVPSLEKWNGYLLGGDESGVIEIRKN